VLGSGLEEMREHMEEEGEDGKKEEVQQQKEREQVLTVTNNSM